MRHPAEKWIEVIGRASRWLIVVAVVAVGMWLLFLEVQANPESTDAILAIATIALVAITAGYVMLTWKMLRVLAHEHVSAQEPLLLLSHEVSTDRDLIVVNIGNYGKGPALCLKAGYHELWELPDRMVGHGLSLDSTVLRPQETMSAELVLSEEFKEVVDAYQRTDEALTVRITYEDPLRNLHIYRLAFSVLLGPGGRYVQLYSETRWRLPSSKRGVFDGDWTRRPESGLAPVFHRSLLGR